MAAGQRLVQRTEHMGIDGDHPSTFVHAPPGGKQQFNIFGGEENHTAPPSRSAAPPAQVSQGAMMQPAAGQRVAQRTEFDGIQDRPSTLVHAAPGGDSAMASIVGGSTAADRIAAMKARRGI